ncbi:hypothetical protein N9924_00335 [bacterium]|jgi:hypothetical protein|nr:hypothetical protein [bacterium]|tara:strand:+ start:311 stop:526 length:216 start_codon:yes stop_codon:yes gene_type:complete
MYAVEIEVEKGEYTLVRKENPWTYDTKVRVFETKERAEEEAARWNTGRVINYLHYIRPMTKEERERAKHVR